MPITACMNAVRSAVSACPDTSLNHRRRRTVLDVTIIRVFMCTAGTRDCMCATRKRPPPRIATASFAPVARQSFPAPRRRNSRRLSNTPAHHGHFAAACRVEPEWLSSPPLRSQGAHKAPGEARPFRIRESVFQRLKAVQISSRRRVNHAEASALRPVQEED